jgi:4-aminobutyrate aminotransferase-like enzyme
VTTASYTTLDERYLHPLADPADRGQADGAGPRQSGTRREELVEAAADQMRRLAFANTYSGWANVPALELAARLEALAYPGLRASFLATSGVDANEAAFKRPWERSDDVC